MDYTIEEVAFTKAIWHLEAALGLLRRHQDGEVASRDPRHFTDSGRLTREGEDFLYALFDAGKNPTEAAKEIGIHPSAAWARQQKWKEMKAKRRS